MADTDTRDGTTRDVNINLRVSRRQRSLIDEAVAAVGRSRSDFMLEAACRQAEEVLLDRRYFQLDQERFETFISMLDTAPEDNAALNALMAKNAPWDQ